MNPEKRRSTARRRQSSMARVLSLGLGPIADRLLARSKPGLGRLAVAYGGHAQGLIG